MNRYAVFSYIKDNVTNESIPVGVVAWSPENRWHKKRFINPDEQLAGVDFQEFMPLLDIVQDKLQHWEETGNLPYSDKKLRPFQDEWWVHVSKLLTHQIHLSEPKAFECKESDEALEALYLSVTRPLRPEKEQQNRLREVVRKCLRDSYFRLHLQTTDPGRFGINLWRGQTESNHIVAAYVGTQNFRQMLEEVAARCHELLTARGDLLFGYLPSPEHHHESREITQLMNERFSNRFLAFDLLRQTDEFRQAAETFAWNR